MASAKDNRRNQRAGQQEDIADVVKAVITRGGFFFPIREWRVFLLHSRAGGPDPCANSGQVCGAVQDLGRWVLCYGHGKLSDLARPHCQ